MVVGAYHKPYNRLLFKTPIVIKFRYYSSNYRLYSRPNLKYITISIIVILKRKEREKT
jgi:hypothetical protein